MSYLKVHIYGDSLCFLIIQQGVPDYCVSSRTFYSVDNNTKIVINKISYLPNNL